MTVPQQQARIQQCLGNLYCKISNKEAIGKDTDADWCVYKKLFLMLMISPYIGYSCDFDCYLNATCGSKSGGLGSHTSPPIDYFISDGEGSLILGNTGSLLLYQ